jgi:AAA+ superfamily predicted ATPase
MAKKDADYIPISDLDAQEGLTLKKLQTICAGAQKKAPAPRPKDSYIELLGWVEENFGHWTGSERLNRFVHNKIIIDGQFLQFCSERGIEVVSIYNDSVVSWKSDYDNEKFFMQGVFHIKKKGINFIHFALFQKGNQNEDEISFGILVDDANYDSYISLRNEYDDWINKRDRSNLQIRVIDGEDISYERDSKWEDIFLPEELKSNIRLTVEGFLKSKDIYEAQRIAWKRGLMLWGNPGNGKTSLIKTIISNYDFKPVTVLPSANDDAMREAFAYAQDQNPALLYFEDLDSLLQNINVSLFLNLLDGISTKNGVLIVATANSLNNFAANIKDRPSRFDRKFEIPLPDETMSLKYFKKWFGNTISDKEIEKLSVYTCKNKFSYAYIKELYISSVYVAIADNRQKPTFADINLAMSQLIADKFNKNDKVIGIDKYLDKKIPNKKK